MLMGWSGLEHPPCLHCCHVLLLLLTRAPVSPARCQGSIGPALAVLFSLVALTYSGMLVSIMFFGGWFIPFFSVLTESQQLAAALLIACLAVARSPSSAIAIISELNAKGPFTTLVLAVTVMMDVVVVVLFTITLMIARTLDQRALMSNDFGEQGPETVAQSIVLSVLTDFGSKVPALRRIALDCSHCPCAPVSASSALDCRSSSRRCSASFSATCCRSSSRGRLARARGPRRAPPSRPSPSPSSALPCARSLSCFR